MMHLLTVWGYFRIILNYDAKGWRGQVHDSNFSMNIGTLNHPLAFSWTALEQNLNFLYQKCV